VKLVVNGVPGLDGEYELIMPPYTTKEWHQIKIRTGLRPLEVEEAWRAGDPDVLTTFAWVAVTRMGVNPADAWAALDECDPFAALTFDFTEEELAAEGDVRPPERSPTPSGNESSPAEPANESEPTEPSGETSRNGGGHPEHVPSPTGSPPSDTGPPSVLQTWATSPPSS
jgi:hypothetical protein